MRLIVVVLRFLRDYFFLLRVPILTWLAVCWSSALMAHSGARFLLRNLLDIPPSQLSWVFLFAGAACFAVYYSTKTILLCAQSRFGVVQPQYRDGVLFVFSMVPVGFILFALIETCIENHNTQLALESFVSLGKSFWLLPILLLVEYLLSPFLIGLVAKPLSAIKLFRDGGYFEPKGSSSHRLLVPHVRCLIWLIVYYFIYQWAIRRQEQALFEGLTVPASAGPPTLALFFAALAFGCFFFSAVTFFCDRFRFPPIAIMLALAGWVSTFHDEHLFQVFSPPPIVRPHPSEVIRSRSKLILIAASGGGIQAAGWTARVLTGLQEKNPNFASTVSLISAVSGGSIAAMYFMRTYRGALPGSEPWSSDQIFRAAVSSNFDPIAWGLFHLDIPRLFGLSSSPLEDRGWALERALRVRGGLTNTKLSDWSPVVAGNLPAIIFNSTLVESGRPLTFSTTQPLMQNPASGVDFVSDIQADIAVTTAVRLSASFAYVSPVARYGNSPHVEHIADGGYFDNSGLASLEDWFTDACGSNHCPPILVIRIVSFPEETYQNAAKLPGGWLYELLAPIDALINIRAAIQQIRGDREFAAFCREHNLKDVIFRYRPPPGCPSPPLSWALTADEINCLQKAWMHTSTEVDVVNGFLR